MAERLEHDLRMAVLLQRVDMVGRLHIVVDGLNLLGGVIASSLVSDELIWLASCPG